MEFTGERYVPGLHGQIELEHVHRYLQASRIAADKVILDIASGEGYGSAMLAAHAKRVIGVDISAEAIQHAQTRYRRDNLEFYVGDCSAIPLGDASVDLVVSFETLEHHDQHDRMMQEVKRVLRPAGLLLLSNPDKLHYTVEPGRLNPYHIKELYKPEFEELLLKYFANRAFFAQRVLYGSGICASQPSGSFNSYLLNTDVVKEFDGLRDPTYWIALASDGSLPDLPSSFLEQSVEESEVANKLKAALSDQERQVIRLTEGLGHRDGQIASQGRELADQRIQIAGLNRDVAGRDEQIASLRQDATNRENQIQILKRDMASRDEQIASLRQDAVDQDGAIADLKKQSVEQSTRVKDKYLAQERWQDSLLRLVAFTPLSLRFPNAWVGHLPFAAWLMQVLSPENFVELGTHSGNSFFAFCQTVAQFGIPTRCYAVDTWRGDEHAGEYDEGIFARVSAHHQQHYREFAGLLRMTFDEARSYFSDGSIGLLHIDGLHTYEAVRWDFESWLPKLAPGAVVLFHDTNVRERNFGVWKLWEELKKQYPLHLEFTHSHGLGVLQLHNGPEHSRLRWLEPDSPDKEKTLDFFGALGSWHAIGAEVIELREHMEYVTGKLTELDGHIRWRDGQIVLLNQTIAERDVQIAERDAQRADLLRALAERDDRIARIVDSRSWKLTSPLRSILKSMRATPPTTGESNGKGSGPEKVRAAYLARFFDAAWYVKKYPDVGASGVDPLEHFASRGGQEARNPHPLFDSEWYLARNPELRKAGVNPLDHFVMEGWKKGINPHPLFDVAWYIGDNPDVQALGVNPLQHFIEYGAREGRRPHHLFDSAWYLDRNSDVRAAGLNPLVHFLEQGWLEGRDPNPDFNVVSYLNAHPDVRAMGVNPLIHYVEFGAAEGRKARLESSSPSVAVQSGAAANAAVANGNVSEAVETESGIRPGHAVRPDISQYLPQGLTPPQAPAHAEIDIIIPVYRGFEETRRCIASVLADNDRPKGLVRVIDDCSPDPDLSAWLSTLGSTGAIVLSRNSENLGFVKTVNLGMEAAGQRDVILLNSDTEVPKGFVQRLAGQAYSRPKIATVTPFSNSAGEMAGFPDKVCRPLPETYSLTAVDQACEEANGRRSLEIPTGVGFCMYIRRACIDEIGMFDADAFSRGYGEETDFCQRALAKGWHHLLACNIFVYHIGEVSFGQNAPERAKSWETLVRRYPHLPAVLQSHLSRHLEVPVIFAATVSLFRASPLPTVLVLSHGFDENNAGDVGDLAAQFALTANVLRLYPIDSSLELSVPSIPGHPTLRFAEGANQDLLTFLHACSISRIHIQHWFGMEASLRELIERLGVPVDLTVQDYAR